LLFWLGICAAGYLGVLLTTKLLGTKTVIAGDTIKPANKSNYWVNCGIAAAAAAAIVYFTIGIFAANKSNYWVNCGIAAAAAAAIVYFTIGIFAQDIPQFDESLGTVMGHPGHRQIAFGVFVSVALAGFAVKQLLQVHYIPVILGAAVIYIGTYTKFIGSDALAYMVKTHPIYFFTNSIFAILPIQFAPFAVLGAITGFWISIFMKYRPKHTE
jgi:hypothetical protein